MLNQVNSILKTIALMVFLLGSLPTYAQVKLIFDTDFGGDADDLGAIAMLHNFIDRGECELLAIMCWSTEEYAVPGLDAVNRFYGHPDIPIGVRKDETHRVDWNHGKAIADAFPSELTHATAEDATPLYRKLLAQNKDHSVVIITVGPLKNIQNLLQSGPDIYSDLGGKALIEKKVKEFVIMGGKFPEGKQEWNFDGNMKGVTRYVLDELTVPITFTGFEVGVAIKSGEIFNEISPETPLYVGFHHFSKHAPWMNAGFKGKILDNSTFDQTAVLYAVRNGVGEYWDRIEGGYCLADSIGGNQWIERTGSNHSYLKLRMGGEHMAQEIESLMLGTFSSSSHPAKVILDTDPGYDPDDVGCMAMLHTMASQGECEILAIVNSTDHKESPLCISAINQFYNRKAIPVGDYKGYAKKVHAKEDTYSFQVANNYPHTLENWEQSMDGVALYREVLASADDRSITVVIIGTMHNFYGLLQSKACQFSTLSGVDLVRQKVKQVVTMGGNFIDGKGLDRTNWGGADALCSYTEWSCLNEERNRMCRYVIDNCPAPFIASGWEVGCGDYHDANFGNVITGQGLKELDENHIVRKSYEYHFETRGGSDNIRRHSNDQCALHFAIRGEGANYQLYGNGHIQLSEAGVCTWTDGSEGVQGYIQKKRDKDLIAVEIESLMKGEIMKADPSPPDPPANVRIKPKQKKKTTLSWDAAEDETIGSWVIGYNIYKNGALVQTAYGTQWITEKKVKRSDVFEIRSLNASGIESEGAKLEN